MNIGDYVRYDYINGDYIEGRILNINGNNAEVEILESNRSMRPFSKEFFSIDELTFLPKTSMDISILQDFIRYNIPFHEVTGHGACYFNMTVPIYTVTGLDFCQLIDNIKSRNVTADEFLFDWYYPFISYIIGSGNVDYADNDIFEGDFLRFVTESLSSIYGMVLDRKEVDLISELKDLFTESENYKNNIGKDLYSRSFTINGIRRYIEREEQLTGFDDLDSKDAALLRKLIFRLSEENDPQGLYLRGKFSYTHSDIFPYNLKEAKECFERYLKLEEKPEVLAKLGMIYFRDGKYEKAFDYLSAGLLGLEREPLLYLGDMYDYGLGVDRNLKLSFQLHYDIYDAMLPAAFRTYDGGLFPEAAMRMGDHYFSGRGTEQDYRIAFDFYLKCRYTFNRRTKYTKTPFDFELLQDLNDSISAVKRELNMKGKQTGILISNNLNIMLESTIHAGDYFEADITQMADQKAKIVIKPHHPRNNHEKKIMVTYTQLEWCAFEKAIVITATNFKFKNGIPLGTIVFDRVDEGKFIMDNCVVSEFMASDFILTIKDLKKYELSN